MNATINIHACVLKVGKGICNTETAIVLKTWIRCDCSYSISQTFHSFNFEKANILLLKKLGYKHFLKEDF